MEKVTGFSVKNCLSAPGLVWKFFKSMLDENDEPIYIFNDNYKRHFVRQSIKGRRVASFNQ